MSIAGISEASLRFDRLETSRLAKAFLISLAVHLLLFGGYKLDRRYHLLEQVHLPPWLKPSHRMETQLLKEAQKAAAAAQQQVPLIFVDVNPAQATAEAPKDAKYYSAQNSRAANPKADRETNVPKIDGTRTEIVRTETVRPSVAKPLQPAAPPKRLEPVVQRTVDPVAPAEIKPMLAPGDSTQAKPADVTRLTEGQADHERKRRLDEVTPEDKVRILGPEYAALAGEKMKQDGGVRRVDLRSSLDVRATPFGAYDDAIVRAVQNQWYNLLGQRDYAGERTGKVVLEFKLHSDGRVSDMKVDENTVSELLCILCQKAVLDPNPYDKWPSDMRRMIGSDTREVTFTFYYY